MRPAIVWALFRKEMRETLRDRRTLFAMLVLPVLLHPLMLLIAGNATVSDEQQRRTVQPRVVVWGPLPARAEAMLVQEIGVRVIARRAAAPSDPAGEARALLDRDGAELVLSVPAGAPAALTADGGVDLGVFYDSVRARSDGARDRLKKALAKWNEDEVAARLGRRALPTGFDRPLKLADQDVASKRRRGADVAGRALPLILLLVMVTCGLLPAIDLTAGEKERGTLQTLLCAPVHSSEIVAGKYLTVVLVSIIGGTANLAAMTFAFGRQFAAVAGDQLEFRLGWSAAASVMAAMIPAALMISALLIALAVFARSFREAQSYLTPVMIGVLTPAIVGILPGVELTAATAFAPICNLTLLARGLMAGTVAPHMFALVMVANLAYSTVAVLLAARVFETEQVLLSGESPWRDVFGRGARTLATPSPRSAVLFAVTVLVAAYYGSVFLEGKGVTRALALVQAGLLALALVWTVAGRHRLRETLSLYLPTRRGWLGAWLLACSTWAVGSAAGAVMAHFFPAARAYEELLRTVFGDVKGPLLLVASIGPAIAEEACYRGVVLSGLANTGSRRVAVLGSAFAFGLLHLHPVHVVTATLLGSIIGFATLESGSILVGAAIHLANNLLVLAAVRVPALAQAMQQWPMIAIGVGFCGLGLWCVRGSRAGKI